MSQSETLTPVEQNISITGDAESAVTIPNKCKYFSMQCRTDVALRFAWTTGKVATPTGVYQTTRATERYTTPEKTSWSGTLYVSAASSVTAEIICWVAD